MAAHRLERTGLRLSLQWRGRQVMLGNLHKPSSKRRPWKGPEVMKEVMGNVIASLARTRPACASSSSLGGGAGEPAASSPLLGGGAGGPAGEPIKFAWAIGGDFNIGPASLDLLGEDFQSLAFGI